MARAWTRPMRSGNRANTAMEPTARVSEHAAAHREQLGALESEAYDVAWLSVD
jgi:hypothetical protein